MKSEKELAFLHDLYVAPDWDERFAELFDTHIELPKAGRALYVAAGTGGHVLALQERAGAKLDVIGVDESDGRLELARAKATAMNQKTAVQLEDVSSLSFADDRFDVVIANASMTQPAELRGMLDEM